MGDFKYATAFLDYTPTAASTPATGFDLSFLKLYERPFLPTRTPDVTAEWWQMDFGSAKALKALYVNNLNFPQITVEVSSDNTFGSDVTALLTAGAVAQDDRVKNRRHGWLDFPSNALSKRYARVTPVGTPDAGASYYQLGALAGFDTVGTFDDDPATGYNWTPREPRTVDRFKSGVQVNRDGDTYLEITFGSEVYRQFSSTIKAQLLALRNAGTFVLWENRGFMQHAYLLIVPDDDPRFTEHVSRFETEFRCEEAV
jgi:hypothetical protein